eukprot:13524754-Alexandrium_andersonii.AAC.1
MQVQTRSISIAQLVRSAMRAVLPSANDPRRGIREIPRSARGAPRAAATAAVRSPVARSQERAGPPQHQS